ncbi:hypothetical protein HUT16_04335 [Kitasatospora sp. NA04385]|uniref:hypothetical protein n=1 Tax=Kitasatospora sp. NA04385 TaxID=2742135 RepID=UPI001592945A|nr:hypothetical protein [Kitasatospora sp. NA04385]QKW18397.1 hypothetical protein HUT16_04335 [Kitasatospora sp. NA04385]
MPEPTPEPTPEARAGRGLTALGEVACRYRAGEVSPADLPMIAAEALAAGLDTPTLCDLAGWPRGADAHDIRTAFEQALAEAGVGLPDPLLAQRHGLRRLAARLLGGEATLAELGADDWWETEVETAEERSFVQLLPQCSCCLEYAFALAPRRWEAELRTAARALVASAPVGPGC